MHVYKLKRADVNQVDLVMVYISAVRPVVQYILAMCGILTCQFTSQIILK